MNPDTTLADIVNANPGAARTLERHHLDYCCGGRQSLADACTANGLDTRAILAEIQEAPARGLPDWTEMGPAELVDHLEANHRYLHEELARLEALAAKVAGVHATRPPRPSGTTSPTRRSTCGRGRRRSDRSADANHRPRGGPSVRRCA